MQSYLAELYPDDVSRITTELEKFSQTLHKVTNPFPNLSWYKFVNLYVLYPDTILSRTEKPLTALLPLLDHIKELGCTAFHILPFFESPLIDKGFDISDYYKIRPDLGTHSDLITIKKRADELGLRVFIDLVFNHVSDQHQWFKKAVQGDEKYRQYFIHCPDKPKFIRKFHKDAAVWGEYEVDGKTETINIAFPESAGEVPHWIQAEDCYWYYHTYYPQQIDVNWLNPDVFIEFAKITMYWAQFGFNFRLDAIPFVGKEAYKKVDCEHERTFAIIAALNQLASQINPECSLIVETYESLPTVIDYFGTSNVRQAELSYNFHLCTSLWVSIIKKDVNFIWEKLKYMNKIPIHAEWINFLRNHDELSLAYLPENIKDEVSTELLPRGASFREGYGVSGRTYSLLGKKTRRFLMAYFLLLSFPDGVAIPYGDELGAKNIPLTKLTAAEKNDNRNINRGYLTKKHFQSATGKRLFKILSHFLKQRSKLHRYVNIEPVRLPHHDLAVFALKYEIGSSQFIVLVNLDNTLKEVALETKGFTNIAQVNRVIIKKNQVKLGAYGGVWLQR
ncbi:MAG TPA: alpha-amylase family glycosyl hydrolase [Vitreimonas sp.]|nr:alpha-amylase family glycosyl hydrolase [Vitreimonas sp.]